MSCSHLISLLSLLPEHALPHTTVVSTFPALDHPVLLSVTHASCNPEHNYITICFAVRLVLLVSPLLPLFTNIPESCSTQTPVFQSSNVTWSSPLLLVACLLPFLFCSWVGMRLTGTWAEHSLIILVKVSFIGPKSYAAPSSFLAVFSKIYDRTPWKCQKEWVHNKNKEYFLSFSHSWAQTEFIDCPSKK